MVKMSATADMHLGIYNHMYGSMYQAFEPVLQNWKKAWPPGIRDHVREILRGYLSYLNQSVLLARECRAALIDWWDMRPLYDRKFAASLSDVSHDQGAAIGARKAFELFFPSCYPKDVRSFVKSMDDRRVEDFRRLVADSLAGKVEFDHDFAVDTLRTLAISSHQTAIRRKIVGYATLPLHFVPVVGLALPKVVDEAAEKLWSDRPVEKFEWYYFMNELVAPN